MPSPSNTSSSSDKCPNNFSVLEIGDGLIDIFERKFVCDERREIQFAGCVILDVARNVSIGNSLSTPGAHNAFAANQVKRVNPNRLATGKITGEDAKPAVIADCVESGFHRFYPTRCFKRVIDAPIGCDTPNFL